MVWNDRVIQDKLERMKRKLSWPNHGAVQLNHSTVHSNHGAVHLNHGTVRPNHGTVRSI